MTNETLLEALSWLKVERGSLACLGCGHEHNCSTHGCAILRAAEETLRGRQDARKTNADIIRAMTDEELAEMLSSMIVKKSDWLDWLQQPAERTLVREFFLGRQEAVLYVDE